MRTGCSRYRGCTAPGRQVGQRERPRRLQSEARDAGSQTKEACVLRVTLNYVTPVCTRRKKRSRSSRRTRSRSQKEIRRELQSNPQTIRILLASPQSALSHGRGGGHDLWAIDPTNDPKIHVGMQ